jgi:hypothetical protein
MATDSAAPAVDLAALRNGLGKALDTLTVLATDLAGGSPAPETISKTTQILRQLGFAPPDTAAQDDEEDDGVDPNTGVPLTPAQRAAKRDRRAWNAQFKGIDAQRAQKAKDNKPGFWPSDMSAHVAAKRAEAKKGR